MGRPSVPVASASSSAASASILLAAAAAAAAVPAALCYVSSLRRRVRDLSRTVEVLESDLSIARAELSAASAEVKEVRADAEEARADAEEARRSHRPSTPPPPPPSSQTPTPTPTPTPVTPQLPPPSPPLSASRPAPQDPPTATTDTRHIHGQRLLTKYIEVGKFLGEGTFGAVHRGRWRGVPVALKFLKSDCPGDVIEEVSRECAVLHEVDHPHVMRLYGICTDDAELPPNWPDRLRPPMLVCELLPGGNFVEFLLATASHREEKARHWRRIAEMLEGAASGLEYLHARGIVHRDMKALNLFVDGRGRLKIGDFGLAKIWKDANGVSVSDADGFGIVPPSMIRQRSHRITVGTWTHQAPELMRGEPPYSYTPAVDIFAFAIIVVEALGADAAEELVDETRVAVPQGRGEPPIFGISIDGVRNLIREDWNCPETNALVHIVETCGSIDPVCRPTAAQLRADLNRVRFAPVHLELQLKTGRSTITSPSRTGAGGKRKIRSLKAASVHI